MDSKKSKNHNVSIWLMACVLILLILLSFAVLASSLKGLTSGEKEVIAVSSNEEPSGFFSLFYKHAKEVVNNSTDILEYQKTIGSKDK